MPECPQKFGPPSEERARATGEKMRKGVEVMGPNVWAHIERILASPQVATPIVEPLAAVNEKTRSRLKLGGEAGR